MLLASTALLALLFPATPGGDEPGGAKLQAIEALDMTLELPELEGMEGTGALSEQVLGRWTGRLSDSDLVITMFAGNAEQNGISIPEAVLMLVEDNAAHDDGSVFRFDETELIEGAYGSTPYALVGRGVLRSDEGEARGSLLAMTGLAKGSFYSIEIEVTPVASKALTKELMHFFEKGVSYAGELADYEWTDEEAEARWRRDVPEDLADDMREVIRTDHYIFLSNASGGALYAKKMEENYRTIQKLYPFPESDQRRLMPIFLFRTPDQYFEFMAKVTGGTKEQAARTAGHAWLDYYATMYKSAVDPTHLHEQVHQIMANRLLLTGGGSWFQEGLAEYAETRKNERSGAAREVKKERHKRLPEFMQLQSLIYSTSGDNVKGGSEAGDLYKQAALFIEFMRESRFAKEGFERFMHEIGRVRRGDIQAIDAVVQAIYEVNLVGLDEEFVDYCKKR